MGVCDVEADVLRVLDHDTEPPELTGGNHLDQLGANFHFTTVDAPPTLQWLLIYTHPTQQAQLPN